MLQKTSDGKSPVRVRFAPSPTGFLHVGGVRTFLFNWLFAQKHHGQLVLRIEDTDQVRSTREYEGMVIHDLKSLHLPYQEGPDVGGNVGPYRQSERLGIYAQHAKKLLQDGRVYYCFCPEELLTQKREVAMKLGRTPHYDGTCTRIPSEEARARVAGGEKAGLRFKAYQRSFTIQDHVRGSVEFKEGMVGDFFVTRTPGQGEGEIAEGIGMPVYNFCCIIDDYLMGITHVIRAEEHLSNTARQLMILEALGWQPPEYAHIALVLGTDRQKLSKRNGDVSVKDYIEKGYLPEALINFLSLLGWWPPAGFAPKSGHPELLSIDEIISTFSLDGLQKAAGVFDVQKLQWMNSQYLRTYPIAEIAMRARPYFEKAGSSLASSPQAWFESVIDLVRGEVNLLSELPVAAEIYTDRVPTLDEEAKQMLAIPTSKAVIETFLAEIQGSQAAITETEVDALQKKVGTLTGIKGKNLFQPMRAVVIGKTHGPELKKVLPIMGRDAAAKRVKELSKQAGLNLGTES